MTRRDQELAKCTACGLCRDVCPATQAGAPSIAVTLSGGTGSVFNCCFCWKCIDVCPHDVDIYLLMSFARQDTRAPLNYRTMAANVADSGRALPISEHRQHNRTRLGLPKLEEISSSLLKIIQFRHSPKDGDAKTRS